MTRTEFEFLIREERREVLESDTSLSEFRRQTVDADDLVHREELIRLRVHANRALYGVAGFEAVLTHLILAHIYIVRAWQVVIIRRAKESVSVRSYFQRTHSNHVLAQIRHDELRLFLLLILLERYLFLCNRSLFFYHRCFFRSNGRCHWLHFLRSSAFLSRLLNYGSFACGLWRLCRSRYFCLLCVNGFCSHIFRHRLSSNHRLVGLVVVCLEVLLHLCHLLFLGTDSS